MGILNSRSKGKEPSRTQRLGPGPDDRQGRCITCGSMTIKADMYCSDCLSSGAYKKETGPQGLPKGIAPDTSREGFLKRYQLTDDIFDHLRADLKARALWTYWHYERKSFFGTELKLIKWVQSETDHLDLMRSFDKYQYSMEPDMGPVLRNLNNIERGIYLLPEFLTSKGSQDKVIEAISQKYPQLSAKDIGFLRDYMETRIKEIVD